MNIARILLPLGLLGSSAAVHAQHPMIVERLKAWNDAAPQPDHAVIVAQVREAARPLYDTRAGCDLANLTIESVRPATADRFAFNGIVARATRNAWFVSTLMPDCDEAPVRFMVTRRADDTLHTVRVNRGISHAWESLLADTIPLAAVAAYSALRRGGHQCDFDGKASLGITRLASPAPNLGDEIYGVRYSGSWSEIWPVTICGKQVEVQVNFRADGDGGAYTDLPGESAHVMP